MPKKAECPHCGAKMVEYRHGLNRGLLVGLRALAKAGWDGKAVGLKSLMLSHSEWDNFQKLRYWDLVSKLPAVKKGGNWKLTERGRLFISGEIPVSKYVVTYRGKRRRFEGPELFVHQIVDGFTYRPAYAKEGRGVAPRVPSAADDQMELL